MCMLTLAIEPIAIAAHVRRDLAIRKINGSTTQIRWEFVKAIIEILMLGLRVFRGRMHKPLNGRHERRLIGQLGPVVEDDNGQGAAISTVLIDRELRQSLLFGGGLKRPLIRAYNCLCHD